MDKNLLNSLKFMNESKNKFMQDLSNHVGLSVGHVPKCGLSVLLLVLTS